MAGAGDRFEFLHTNTLADDDMCLATPALAGDRLLIRSAHRLYCIGRKPWEEGVSSLCAGTLSRLISRRTNWGGSGKVDAAQALLRSCKVCPRDCEVDRLGGPDRRL